MKLLSLMVAIMLVTALHAEIMEVKTADGYKQQLTTIPGTYNSKYNNRFPYVCYDKRVQVIIDGEQYLTYKGCTRVDASCASVGRVHFGKYPNDYQSNQALNRCINARPRFVD